MKNESKFNVLLVVSNLAMLGSFIAYLIFRNKLTKSLFWLLIPLLILIVIYFINKWSKRGLNIDKSNSNEIQRSFDDSTAVASVIYFSIYLGVMFIEGLNEKITSNIYVISGFYFITLVFEVMSYLSVFVAKRDTKNLAEETYNKKLQK